MPVTRTLALALRAPATLACTAGMTIIGSAVVGPAIVSPAIVSPALAAAQRTGCSEAGETDALGFAVAALVTDNKSEPNDVHLKADAYKVDEPLRIFLVPAGYVCTQEKTGYRADFNMSIQVIYRGDVVADQPNVKAFDFPSEVKIQRIKINMDDKISGLIPGAFALRVTLADTVGDRSAEVILPFTIAP